MNEKMLWQYARLVVEVGVNLQKGQRLVINCPVECAQFARLCTKAAYDAGAKDVLLNWRDDFCSRERWLRGDDSLFDAAYPWDVMRNRTLAEEGAGYLTIDASDPENLRGVDPERLRRWEIANGRDQEDFYRMMMASTFPWCVVSIPVASWAKKVFPGLPVEAAMERLWDQIFKAVRITEDGDAVEEWRRHCARLGELSERLNSYDFEYLHYTNSLGTDLTVGLPENHIWAAGGDTAKSGVCFVANMPTEEVFTAPKRDAINGVLYASLPLILNGNIVKGIRFTFRDGRITDIHSETCEDILRASVNTDEGAHYIGEVALVPYDSPISSSGVLFFNTLFDENASCHFAYGEAYPSCIKGGTDMTKEELLAAGINAKSSTHVDFMVGTKDLSVVGVTRKGQRVEVLRDGKFTF